MESVMSQWKRLSLINMSYDDDLVIGNIMFADTDNALILKVMEVIDGKNIKNDLDDADEELNAECADGYVVL